VRERTQSKALHPTAKDFLVPAQAVRARIHDAVLPCIEAPRIKADAWCRNLKPLCNQVVFSFLIPNLRAFQQRHASKLPLSDGEN
jgi:hypothetical protein